MFHCHVCGAHTAKEGYISEVFDIDRHLLMVEQIPAQICARCGEEIISRDTTEHIRRLVNSKRQPVRSVTMDVFAYA